MLIDREPIQPGDDAPDFAFAYGGATHRVSDFRGSPVVLAFHGAEWDPARAEHIETYNKLIASLGGVAGARLLQIGGARARGGLWFSPPPPFPSPLSPGPRVCP